MLANVKFLFFVSLWLYGVHAIVVPVRISKGAIVKQIRNLIYYEASLPLLYEVQIPTFKKIKNFTRENCEGYGECKLYDDLQLILQRAESAISHTLTFEDLNSTATTPKRFKRAINLIGEMAEYCCNIASSETVNSLFVNEHHLDTFMAQIKAELTEEHKTTVNTRELLNSYSSEMENVMKKLSATSRADIRDLAEAEGKTSDRLMQLTAVLFTTGRILYQHAQTTSFLKAQSDCDNGKIPSFFIPHEEFRKDLLQLEKRAMNDGYSLPIPTSSLSKYYHIPTTSCSFTNTKVLVKVKVPVIRNSTTCQLYHLNILPFAYEESNCKLNLDIEYVAACDNEIIPLFGSMLETCNPSKDTLCFLSQYKRISSLSRSCASLLISHHATAREIAANCPLTCTKHDGKSMFVSQVDGNNFIILNPHSPIKLQCKGKADVSTPINITNGHMNLHVACGCSASIGNQSISPHYPCFSSSTKSVIHQVIPSFFSNLDATIITENTMVSNLEDVLAKNWTIKIPHLNLSAPPRLEDIDIPLIMHVSTHLSLLTTLWLIVITAVDCWLIYRIIKIPALSAFTSPAVGLSDQALVEMTFTVVEIFVLLLILFMMLIIYLLLRRSGLLSVSQRDITNELGKWSRGEIKFKLHDDAEDITMKHKIRKLAKKRKLSHDEPSIVQFDAPEPPPLRRLTIQRNTVLECLQRLLTVQQKVQDNEIRLNSLNLIVQRQEEILHKLQTLSDSVQAVQITLTDLSHFVEERLVIVGRETPDDIHDGPREGADSPRTS
ncbi:unnamed protein product [Orchesella dallaii]|uniref:Envelope fusion protein n=1 Tax=Orchesella dallaii TaxID=48710 RepID=A0ABP1RG18_9HEXA